MLQNIILISVTTATSKITLTTPKESVLISSPNYPGNYPNNVEITVNISAPRGTNVELIFGICNYHHPVVTLWLSLKVCYIYCFKHDELKIIQI